MKIRVTVNGELHEADVAPRTLLVHWLREELALTGTHIGCETSLCGACTVHVDGRAVKSCTMFAVQADGRSVTTIEAMGEADALHPLQTGFWEEHGLQCGYCTPGMSAVQGAGPTLPRSSSKLKTPTTPGSASARRASIRRMRPAAYWLRTKATCSMPRSARSSVYVARPRIRRGSSRRLMRWPTWTGFTGISSEPPV